MSNNETLRTLHAQAQAAFSAAEAVEEAQRKVAYAKLADMERDCISLVNALKARGEGIEDTIRDGENGFLVPAGDVDETERVMRAVFAHPQDYAALRERGRQDARALTWARNARLTEDVYRQALRGGRQSDAQNRH